MVCYLITIMIIVLYTVPTPSISIVFAQNDTTWFAGSTNSLTCLIREMSNTYLLTTPYEVDVVLFRNEKEIGQKVCQSLYNCSYIHNFTLLSSIDDSGLYYCSVTVKSHDDYEYIT